MISSKRYYFLLGLISIVYCFGMFSPLIEFDSNQFAVMAMRMYQENDFINLIKGNEEYLDKPHMHYWLAAISYKIFGINDWAYRIPAILLTALATYSCFGLGKLLYNKSVGLVAALMFLTAQTIVLSNIDVRTDAVLTAFTIFSIWQLALYIEKNKLLNIILGAIGAAFAFSTKGQIAIVVIGLSILCHLLYTKKWNRLWSWKILIGFLVFAIFITPMLYAYYIQFDLHPEKVIRGKNNRSGIFFILWEQSFERMSGEGIGTNSSDFFFFYHTLLWEFIPWTFIMLGAFYFRTLEFVKIRFKSKPNMEFLTIGSILIIFQLVSFAQFKLPHYLNVLIPLIAILTASFLYNLYENKKEKSLNIILKFQYLVVGILSICAVLLLFFVFGAAKLYVIVFSILLFILLVYFIFLKENKLSKIITISVVAFVMLNTIMNSHFYPNLLKYQAGYQIALKAKAFNISENTIYKISDTHTWALDFYTKRPTPVISNTEIKEKAKTDNVWLYVNENELELIKNEGFNIDKKIVSPQFRITRLSLKFLNPATRDKVLNYMYLIHINS